MRAIDKPHVAAVVSQAIRQGAKVEDAAKAKVVQMSLKDSRFFVIGNDVTPTFAFHPELKAVLSGLGIEFQLGKHSGLGDFPRAAGARQHNCLRINKTNDAMRVLREVLA
jgi:hypothetical protein